MSALSSFIEFWWNKLMVVINLRVNTQANFPASIVGQAPVVIAKANGVWNVSLNPGSLGQVTTPPAGALIMVWTPGNPGVWNTVPIANLSTSSRVALKATVNFNSANTDTAISVILPTGWTGYQVASVKVAGPSAVINTATGGLFTGAGGTGVTIVTNGAIGITTIADATTGNSSSLAVNNSGVESYSIANESTLFFRVGTAQGVAATATVIIELQLVY